MNCPRCDSLTQYEDDDISQYLLCRTCGWMGHVDRQGNRYIPPTALEEQDEPDAAIHRGPQLKAKHESKEYRDGCKVHDHCLTCPFPACIVSDRGAYEKLVKAKERVQWFGGKAPSAITMADIEAEQVRGGVNERTVWRRLAVLRKEAV